MLLQQNVVGIRDPFRMQKEPGLQCIKYLLMIWWLYHESILKVILLSSRRGQLNCIRCGTMYINDFSFVVAADCLRDSHQALFFHQAILVFKNSALDGFYPFLVVFNKMVTD